MKLRLLSGATAAALAASTLAANPAWAQDDPVVLSVGHIDALDVHYSDGNLTLKVKDDTAPPTVVREAADVIFQALPDAAVQVPDDPRYAFLGDPGDTVWVLPQVQDPDLLWPGWSTERLPSGVFANNRVTFTLESVDGPGMVSVFNVDAFGNPIRRWHAEGGTVNPNSIDVPTNTHAHASWAFGAEGTYTLTFRADATLAGGGTLTSGPVKYQFVVGDLPDDPGDPGDPGDPPDPALSQEIQATVPADDGALVISVDPEDRTVIMSTAQIGGSADRLVSTGTLRPVTVTDTRPSAPGWNVSGQVGEFTGSSGTFSGRYLGWSPNVLEQAVGQGVQAGAAVQPGFESGDGLTASRTLASAGSGNGLGTARLDAVLRLELPTQTPAGEYLATLTLTAI